MTAVDGVGDAAGEVDVVVLKQNHIEEPYAVVHSPANLHSLLLQDAHAGRCLPRVKDMAARSLHAFHVTVGHRRYAAHALHDVQHEAFSL